MLALRKSLRNWIVMIFRAFVCQTFQLQQQHQQWWWRASCARPVFRYDKAWKACAQHTTRGSICRTVTYSMLEIYFAFETLSLNNPTWSNG